MMTALEYATKVVREQGTDLPADKVQEVFGRVRTEDLEPSYWDVEGVLAEVDPGAGPEAYRAVVSIMMAIEMAVTCLPPHATLRECVRGAVRLAFSKEHGGWGLCPDETQPDSRDDECPVCWQMRFLAGEELPTV
jgi:hypothetical protein